MSNEEEIGQRIFILTGNNSICFKIRSSLSVSVATIQLNKNNAIKGICTFRQVQDNQRDRVAPLSAA